MRLIATIPPCGDGTLKACFADAEYIFSRDQLGRVLGDVPVAAHFDHLVATGNFVPFGDGDSSSEKAPGQTEDKKPKSVAQGDQDPAAKVEEPEPVITPTASDPLPVSDEFSEQTDEDLRNEIELRSGTRPAATDDRAALVLALRALRVG